MKLYKQSWLSSLLLLISWLFFEIQMEGNWHCSAQLCILTSCLRCRIPKQRQPAGVFWCHPPTHITSSLRFLLKRDLRRSHNQARLSAGLPLLIHVLLPFRRLAAEKTLSGWVHIPAITARLPQLTSLRSFLCERAGCQVSEAPFPFPKPLSSCLPHQQNAGSALQSDHHGDSSFVFQPVALDRSHAALSPAPARQDCKWQDL